ncbi:hypothetical protein HL653_02305 [Sphingomonas sp. AP4-R1]|uniref:hypothetical protein n=1 Tax=Sphingomonas sp. AP4-R1 TaxID=2735134 RepID=UPI0014932FE8|nr:hypothetical protein [Sphingomonas sp. AP4-R1]QJU56774.1 hypothetical protein HL653_02305 [Sphingomonas sp. AP4-R1]
MTMLRPLLPLLMLIPFIAISGAVRAATPAETARQAPIHAQAPFVVSDDARAGSRTAR